MRTLKVALLVLLLPLFAYGAGGPPVVVGEIWRSKDSERVLTVLRGSKAEMRDGDLRAVARLKCEGKKVTATTSFFGQEIRVEFRRVEGALVGPNNLMLFPSAELTAMERIDRSKRALTLIGKHLKALEKKGQLRKYSGAAFLLQIRDRLSDEELACFRGGQGPDVFPFPEKPRPGTKEYVKGIRSADLAKGIENWHCAYAGPNWRQFPERRAGGVERRVWACDRCYMGNPAHAGIVLLWNDLTVEFVPIAKIRGADPVDGLVVVGPNSPDERLKKMTYFSQ
jgi:hypothetical protein